MVDFDQYQQERVAQCPIVEYQTAVGSPPVHGSAWKPLFGGFASEIRQAIGVTSYNTALIRIPEARWSDDVDIQWGDRVRIRTDAVSDAESVTLFSGFATGFREGFGSAGGAGGARSYEQLSIRCYGHLWALAATSPVYRMLARRQDDYANYGTSSQQPYNDYRVGVFVGRPIVFNERIRGSSARPNKDPDELLVKRNGESLCYIPIFSGQPDATWWTARDMVRHLLSYPHNGCYDQWPIDDPGDLIDLNHDDWDAVLHHVVVDGLDVVAAAAHVAEQIGWTLREDYDAAGEPQLVFYRLGAATGYVRDDLTRCVRHVLYAPAVGESVAQAAAAGAKLICSAEIDEDISNAVNAPIGRGATDEFEVTVNLVPGWMDDDVEPDLSESNAHLYFLEADLQGMESPNNESFYANYHTSGNAFRRAAGRKWVLNEAGHYSLAPYDRGAPFDFTTVIDAAYSEDADGRAAYAPFRRSLLRCLTVDSADPPSSVGIKVEFSFDKGATWQAIPCGIESLPHEAGVWISEPNLAEIAPPGNQTITGGALDGVALNYWTSLADDEAAYRAWKDDEWFTRVRVTATVRMDQRVWCEAQPTRTGGSPFRLCRCIDRPDYHFSRREASSVFYGGSMSAWNQDEQAKLDATIAALRDTEQDPAIAGRFVLDRLWTDDGDGGPVFCCGDLVERIDGRGHRFRSDVDGGALPEIVRVIYDFEAQRQTLITRDPRFMTPQH